MAKLSVVQKKTKLDLWDIIKFQFITHCYLEKMTVSDAELSCLTLLAKQGECNLSEFCEMARDKQFFKTTQSARNLITKMEKSGLILKKGNTKKMILINPELNIQAEGNMLLEFKFAHLASEKA